MSLLLIEMILPIIVMIFVGYLLNKKQVFNLSGLSALKSIIGNICLPVVLFNAFFYADYGIDTLIVFITVYIAHTLALFIGFIARPILKDKGKFLPVLVSGAEGGMLGYALYILLYPKGVSTFAMVDIGQTFFAYTAFLSALKIIDGKKVSVKELTHNMLTNFCFIGMVLGVVLGSLGFDELLISLSYSNVLDSAIAMITAPTATIVLIIVGYELSLEKNLLKPVLKTIVIRLLIMITLSAVTLGVLSLLIELNYELMFAILLMYSLPAPFIIPLFADVKKDANYISTTLSINTLITMILFSVIIVFRFMV